jgi:hypothetical protein
MNHFVPATEELSHGRGVSGVEGDLFRKIMNDGTVFYGAETGQGVYAATADGELLGEVHPSIREVGPEGVAAMLKQALEKWEAIPADRRPQGPPEGAPPRYLRRGAALPEDGIALQLFARDLPREKCGATDWRTRAWNMDHVWLTRGDMKSFLPRRPAAGKTARVASRVERRLARYHFLDTVRGLTPRFPLQAVKRARLSTEVVGLGQESVRLRLRGEFGSHEVGHWSVDGGVTSAPRERGIAGSLLGRLTVDRRTDQFKTFEAVMLGTRWGGTMYNSRSDDLGPNPIGFALVLTDDPIARAVPPHFVLPYFKFNYWQATGR